MKIKDVKASLRDYAIPEIVLNILQKRNLPINEEDLLIEIRDYTGTEVTTHALTRATDELKRKGYDINEITSKNETQYTLVRTGKHSGPIFRASGHITLPILLTGDFHMGSKAFSELAWKELLKDIKKYKIKHILILGDLLQGLKVYSKELRDLASVDIDAQVKLAEDYLKMIPKNIKMHCVMGNHEECLKGQRQVGFDALKYLASRISNLYYYGDKMDLILNRKYRLSGFHSAGGISQTTSHKAEKIWKELSDKPDILAIAHNHRLYTIARESKLLLETGTLQRETNLVIQKGITTTVGWWVITGFSHDTVNLIKRTPLIY